MVMFLILAGVCYGHTFNGSIKVILEWFVWSWGRTGNLDSDVCRPNRDIVVLKVRGPSCVM